MPPCDADSIRAILRRLYRGVDGYEIEESQERRIERVQSSPLYGEIMPTATLQLVDTLELGPDDVFVDLGSGVGKVVLTAALRTEVGRVVGVELASDRHQRAVEVLKMAEAEGSIRPGRVELRNHDAMRSSLADATVLYTCSTAFPYSFTERLARRARRLARPVRFVTQMELDPELPGFALDAILRLDMSWARKRRVHVYWVNA